MTDDQQAILGTSSSATGTASTSDGLMIPNEVSANHPDLVSMLQESTTLDLDEKNYWLQMIPVMNEEQLSELRSILLDEKAKKIEVDQKYEEEVNQAMQQKTIEMRAFEEQKRREAIRLAESATKESESSSADALLSQLNNL